MPVFVQMLYYMATMGFNEKKDTRDANEVMNNIQQKGGKILDVKVSVGMGEMGDKANIRAIAAYLITYEAPAPIEID